MIKLNRYFVRFVTFQIGSGPGWAAEAAFSMLLHGSAKCLLLAFVCRVAGPRKEGGKAVVEVCEAQLLPPAPHSASIGKVSLRRKWRKNWKTKEGTVGNGKYCCFARHRLGFLPRETGLTELLVCSLALWRWGQQGEYSHVNPCSQPRSTPASQQGHRRGHTDTCQQPLVLLRACELHWGAPALSAPMGCSAGHPPFV